MTLQKKFAALTPEQQETFGAVKDGAGLDAFLAETGLELADNEKTQVLEYLASGKMPLADEELINIAGGGCVGEQDPKTKVVAVWKKSAESEGRGTHVGISTSGAFHIYYWQEARCPSCNVEGSVFGASKSEIIKDPINSDTYQIFLDVKCYVCNATAGQAYMFASNNLRW